MEEKNQAHNTYNQCFQQQITLQSADGILNQPGTVIPGYNFDPLGQCSLNSSKFFLHARDDIQSIQPVTHDHDAADCFTLALPFGYAFSNIRAE